MPEQNGTPLATTGPEAKRLWSPLGRGFSPSCYLKVGCAGLLPGLAQLWMMKTFAPYMPSLHAGISEFSLRRRIDRLVTRFILRRLPVSFPSTTLLRDAVWFECPRWTPPSRRLSPLEPVSTLSKNHSVLARFSRITTAGNKRPAPVVASAGPEGG